jgi:hypothetical protein
LKDGDDFQSPESAGSLCGQAGNNVLCEEGNFLACFGYYTYLARESKAQRGKSSEILKRQKLL